MPRQQKNSFQVPPTPRSPVPVPMAFSKSLPPPKLWHQSQPTGFLTHLKEGFAFGTGSEIARSLIRSVTTPTVIQKTEYELCVENKWNTVEACKDLYKSEPVSTHF